MPRFAERTKVCNRCKQRKPWAAFYPRYRLPDGSVGNVTSACKECHNAASIARRRADREKDREVSRRYRERLKQDPERYARIRVKAREYKRVYKLRHGGRPGLTLPKDHAKPLPAEPFREWLLALAHDQAEIARLTGLSHDTVRNILRRNAPVVRLDVVDRACLAVGVSIDSIYEPQEAM